MKVKLSTISNLCLLLLSLIIFCNLNGIITLLFGITAPLSILILIFSLTIIAINYISPEPIRVDNNLVFIIVIFFLYLTISTCSLLWDSSMLSERTSIVELYRSYLSSLIIISAFYFGIGTYYKSSKKIFSTSFFTPFFVVTLLFVLFGGEIGIYENIVGKHQAFGEERSSGLFGNPNEAGVFANYALVIFLASFASSKHRLFYLGLCVLAFAAAVVSFSKAALIISVLIILFFLFRSIAWFKFNSKGLNRYLFLTLFLIFSSVFYIVVNFSGFYENLTRNQKIRVVGTLALMKGEINQYTTSSRTIVYEHGWSLIKKRPIIGNGFGSFHRFNSGKARFGVHNTFLLIIGESGFLPLLLFLIFFMTLFFKGMLLDHLGIGFFISGIVIVFLANMCGTGHHALDERTSNALIGIIIGILYRIRTN